MIRLKPAAKWPVVEAVGSLDTWSRGLGQYAIARREGEGRIVFGIFLVDVFCLGVKNAFWKAGTLGDFRDVVQEMEKTRELAPINPACLVKTVKGAVEYARSLGFSPHPDYRATAMLLEGTVARANPSTSEGPASRSRKPRRSPPGWSTRAATS
jgi:hypothetical protein